MEHSSASDEALVNAARKGDLEAFEELVARHRDRTFARAFSMLRNREEAVELCQEAWVKSWQKLPRFEGESSFGTWITRIVINLCLDQLRKWKRQRTESINEMEESTRDRRLPATITNPAEGLERGEVWERIDAALGQLSEAHRTALVLREFEEMGYREIAEKMGCSIGTVMSRLFYARERMAEMLADLRPARRGTVGNG
jgi:RNA polymerase sigma-70 factor, ECF subfamily